METLSDAPPPTSEPAGDPPPFRRPGSRLTRSTDDKVVAGLSAGLGRYFGIDPVVFRIAFVVLTLAGGSGILLYLVGWLMIPDDAGRAALKRLGTGRYQKLAAAVLAGAGLLLLLDNIWGGDDDITIGLLLVALGGLFLWSRHRDEAGTGGPATDGPAPADHSPPAAAPAHDADAAPPPQPPPPPAGGDVGRPAPRPAAARSSLVPVTLSLLVVLAGVATLFGLSFTTGLALALLLTGVALMVGAWRGRARWLIPLGLVLSVALAGASLIDVPLRGGAGEVGYYPQTVDEIATPYRLGAGELVVDLSAIDFRGRTVTVVASVGLGYLDIVVPPDVSVEVDAHVGAGQLSLFDTESDGLSIGRRVTDQGDGSGRLVLRARAGMGLVEVSRAAP